MTPETPLRSANRQGLELHSKDVLVEMVLDAREKLDAIRAVFERWEIKSTWKGKDHDGQTRYHP